MKYFKNTELAKIYNTSEKSVRNWIQAAREGKLELQLQDENGKLYVANTNGNTALIEKLVQKGKKYKNSKSVKVISPGKKFYSVYNQKEILDIISNLIVHKEVPTKYTYVDGAAQRWDEYANRLNNEQTPNILIRTIELLEDGASNIDHLFDDHKRINVVDLGPGNGLPVRETLTRLLEYGRLNRYIAIDGSKEMLRILENNIRAWFGDAIKFEGYIRDFSEERFDDLFADDYAGGDENIPANLVFLLGGTLSNFRSPSRALQTINGSLSPNDLLIYSGYLDTPKTRRYFDYTSRPNQKMRSELILSLLNIDDSLYDTEMLFSQEESARYLRFKPKVDLLIRFELANGVREVELRKGDAILLWRHWHKSAIDLIKQFDQDSFDLMLVTKSKDQEYFLLASKIKIDE